MCYERPRPADLRKDTLGDWRGQGLVKNLTSEWKDAHREIPWRAIAGMRDVTAHKYQTLRKEDVYRTCAEDIPEFEARLSRLMEQ